MNLPVPRHTITSICAARDASLATMQLAADTLAEGYALSKEATNKARIASGGHWDSDLLKNDFNPERAMREFG